eukprot:CAMPEP_0182595670 /NCGR_PEP_ID=MMETSP1324-20130603/82733_1 /TAXON_ID=236786 /ORGANISM="Florenciella sp., Strain RCC1587" /LENGTH=61 /DNA_ID=CAMNT_0024813291 /DNA_START=71 /DNA_END=253 /DNA_ORIENTATION=+
MAHEHTTADRVVSAADSLGLERHLRIHVTDAFDFGKSAGAGSRRAALYFAEANPASRKPPT